MHFLNSLRKEEGAMSTITIITNKVKLELAESTGGMCPSGHAGAIWVTLRDIETKLPVSQWFRCPHHAPELHLPETVKEALALIALKPNPKKPKTKIRILDSE